MLKDKRLHMESLCSEHVESILFLQGMYLERASCPQRHSSLEFGAFSSKIVDSFIAGQRCRYKQKALTGEQNEKAEVINRRRERRE